MIRYLLKKSIRLLPEYLEEKILRIWRFRKRWKLWIQRLKVRLFASKTVTRYLSDNTVYWIDPRKVVYAMDSEGFYPNGETPKNRTGFEFNIYEYNGLVLGGDWDKLERKFSELDFYRTYEERVSKGTSWEQLPYYQRVLKQIENGIEKWGCTSKENLDERCHMLDGIFNEIRQNGYKSRGLQKEQRGKDRLFDGEDEITVNIGRHGDLIFNNGRHRMTFAKLAEIEKVPVAITVRHSAWENFKREIEEYAQLNNGRIYAPLTHIDLQNIPSHYSQDRFETINRNLGEGNRTLLDIGAHWGYFCHRFEDEGLNCTAVEHYPLHLYFLNKLRRAENRRFEVLSDSILTLSKRGPLKYDIVLALAIFHHFLKEEETFEGLKHLLNNLDTKEMYFEPQLYDEAQMEGAFRNLSPEEFVDFILQNSCLRYHKEIGRCEEGRPVYKLWR